MEMTQYLNVFMDEVQEHLQTLNTSLLALENNPADSSLLEAIFRAAHTLKGASATMGFNKMSNITHAMEDLLTRLRNGEIAVSSEIINVLFECFDLLDALAQGIAAGHEEDIEAAGLLTQLRMLASAGKKEVTITAARSVKHEIKPEYNRDEKALIEESISNGRILYHVSVKLREDCLLKGARAFMVLRELEKLGQVVRTWPLTKDLEDENFDDHFIIGVLSVENTEKVKSPVASITDVEIVAVEHIDLAGLPLSQSEEGTKETVRGTGVIRSGAVPRAVTSPTVRVEIKKLDDLMNIVAELVIQRSQLEQLSEALESKRLNEVVEHFSRLTVDLRDRVLRARMVQVDSVFSRFPRLVRDLSRDLSKEISLEIVGGDTELDRTVIDHIGDPLMHLIRNAVDHGIESPSERLQAGKPQEGRLTLRAYQESNTVVIVIEDDGRGYNLERLRQKAVDGGFVTEEESRRYTDEELIELVFIPGLSTAQQVTDVSGRGVGMDVVKNAIEGLGGVISIKSEYGVGTAVQVRLPLTLAIIQTMLVRSGDETYAIPTSYIEQTISVGSREVQNFRGQEVVNIRGDILPLLRLNRLVDTPVSSAPESPELDAIIIKIGEHRVLLVVDQLIRQQDIVIRPLGGYLGKIEGIAGGTVLGDGSIALVLDMRVVA
ncbi:MAG TPA: chemotaxis protein CheA [Firmicutes bacterium]|jgi:two-component system chemotaxis sensor kinase CheA|nr:chemotaxis protein CheA [Bacillota bacterium]HAZ22940.1 chemotaxis protein CheA [Bacillota bacterium]HBE05994.1 chemotaxis protein CheA [Bacillota bacterium]HBG43135.1 chemotaxis protein CheA [Bacillota bacterium]HBL50960.1 chemotaxis protein CheA [Bacillota bacterium]